MDSYTIKRYDLYSLLVQWNSEIDVDTNQKIHLVAKALSTIQETEEVVPAYQSLLWIAKKHISDYDQTIKYIKRVIDKIIISDPVSHKKVLYNIPVCYDDIFAPDMEILEKYSELTRNNIISIHTSAIYHVYMMGFLPGFPFLGGLDTRLHLPRRKKPRANVPGGAVGIGGDQTGIYPIDSPGGWNIIGKCPLPLYLPKERPPMLIRANSNFKFKAIGLEEYKALMDQSSEFLAYPDKLHKLVRDEGSF
jgi:inhibitor of KinA